MTLFCRGHTVKVFIKEVTYESSPVHFVVAILKNEDVKSILIMKILTEEKDLIIENIKIYILVILVESAGSIQHLENTPRISQNHLRLELDLFTLKITYFISETLGDCVRNGILRGIQLHICDACSSRRKSFRY